MSTKAQTGNNPMSINSKTDTFTVIYPYNGMPLSHRKGQIADVTWVSLIDVILSKKRKKRKKKATVYIIWFYL